MTYPPPENLISLMEKHQSSLSGLTRLVPEYVAATSENEEYSSHRDIRREASEKVCRTAHTAILKRAEPTASS
jgi:hypothetical protein